MSGDIKTFVLMLVNPNPGPIEIGPGDFIYPTWYFNFRGVSFGVDGVDGSVGQESFLPDMTNGFVYAGPIPSGEVTFEFTTTTSFWDGFRPNYISLIYDGEDEFGSESSENTIILAGLQILDSTGELLNLFTQFKLNNPITYPTVDDFWTDRVKCVEL